MRKAGDSLNFLTLLIQYLPGHVYWVSEDGIVLGTNDEQARAAGFSKSENFVGKSLKDSLWAAEADKVISSNKKILAYGKAVTIKEKVIINKKKKIFLSTKIPIFDESIKSRSILGISIDITEREELEEKLQQSETREARFKAMSALSGMIAHELRTPLMAIELALDTWRDDFHKIFQGYQIYAKEHNDDTFYKPKLIAMEAALDNAKHSVRDAHHTINSILVDTHYAMEDNAIDYHPFNIREMIISALEQYPFEAREKLLVTLKPFAECQAIGDPGIVIHVLHNLIKNALFAIAEMAKGSIIIDVKAHQNYVTILFEDTGKGITKDILPHIFEPFFTTKKERAASIGIGLHFCQLALQKMKGSIQCDSEEGHYTRFSIRLPTVECKA